ncbi:Cdc6/Cdc18 family protein [Halobaculum gomorrense]|uniref:Cdc6-related protein, AAA superfamily ATPase n=1 Tax=Halobaculum gomorrense TaxID=43928 RepID=A0A1M5UBF9_9EURY|nr:AAA family ATPase [Halobaculum gomorrense]SHH60352.1 Cdc6-related protein, AAA superfamily ATPase [Halobaculum gomorrense]
MDIEDRIARRQRTGERHRLVLDEDALSPVWHPEEPIGRGPLIERLLDYFDPVFDGRAPPNGYLYGPGGTGKSAVTVSLVDRLAEVLSSTGDALYTTTRGASAPGVSFVRVDLRTADSAFEFSHAVLDALTAESVPRRGVGADELHERLERHVRGAGPVVVVADHMGEPETVDVPTVARRLGAVEGTFAWLAVGRADPDEVGVPDDAATIEVEPYSRATLTDLVAARADAGLGQGALAHRSVRGLAEWAEGDAGVALSALLGAVEAASTDGDAGTTLDEETVEAGMAAVPWPCVPLGRVLALPTNRVRALACLVELNPADRAPVSDCAARIADRVDLTTSTVERFLYELAEAGIVERVRLDGVDGPGRPPSRVDPRFPTLAFRRLVRRRVDEVAV